MAGQLIDALAGEFDSSKYVDAFSERVQKAVEEKLAGKEITAAPAPKDNMMDLLAALQASLADGQKQKTG
jgi:DNA end-binding protein Ku